MSKVSVVRCPDYEYSKVKESVSRAINLAGSLGKDVKKGDKVLLKVNLLQARKPEDAVTTHPAVVKAVCEEILDCKAEPFVGDVLNIQMDRGLNSMELSGIKSVCDELGVRAVDLKSNGFVKVDIPRSVQMKSLWIAKDVLDADVVISLPKMKTHMLTGYTGAIKNFFGCIPFGERMRSHLVGTDYNFSEVLGDIYSVIKPGFCVMDGIEGMEGAGPSHGDKRTFALVAAGRDCVSVDAVCSDLMGFGNVNTVSIADKRRLGIGDLKKIEVVGDIVEHFSTKMPNISIRKSQKIAVFIPPPVKDFLAGTLLKIEPRVDESKCKKCAVCRNACPARAITMDNYPSFDRKKCLKCFCCHELCPEGAIYTYKSWLARKWR